MQWTGGLRRSVQGAALGAALCSAVALGLVIGGGDATAQAPPPFIKARVGQTKSIAKRNGFRWQLACLAGPQTVIQVFNDAGGDDSHLDNNHGPEYNDMDEGQTFEVLSADGISDVEEGHFVLFGGNSTVQAGHLGVLNRPNTGFEGTDCVAFIKFFP